MTNGVGANNSCSALFMQVGSKGMTGNMYSSGYRRDVIAITLMVRAL